MKACGVQLAQYLTPMHQLVMLLGAAVHDLGHTGRFGLQPRPLGCRLCARTAQCITVAVRSFIGGPLLAHPSHRSSE